eukprot:jgi/Ulvmu1/10936/UM007_0115.1
MSSDGCREVAWKGQAFPYLMHHPRSTESDSYAKQRQREQAEASEPAQRKVAAGTWNGPAPRGFLPSSQHGQTVSPQADIRPIPKQTRVGSHAMPMVIVNTEKASGGDLDNVLKAGYRALDCSPSYGNQDDVGKAILQSSVPREDLFVISKVPSDAKRPDDLKKSVAATLTALSCTYLDLLVLEWPCNWEPGTQDTDPSADPAATWTAMEGLVADGSVRQLGVAHHGLSDVEALLESAKSAKPVVNMLELHPLCSQRKLVGQLLRKGVVPVACAAAGGEELRKHADVCKVAEAAGHAVPEVLLKWSAQRGTPAVVDVATAAAVDIGTFFTWRMSEEREKVVLDKLDEGKRFVDPGFIDFSKSAEGSVKKPSAVLQYGS